MKGEIVQMRLFDLGMAVDLRRVTSLLGQAPRPAPVEAQSAAPSTSRFPQPLEVRYGLREGPAGCQVEVRVHELGVVTVRARWPCQAEGIEGFAHAAAAVRLDGQAEDQWARDVATRVRQDLAGVLVGPNQGPLHEERYVAFCVHLTPDEVPAFLERQSDAIARVTSDSVGTDLVPARLAAAQKHTLQYTSGDAVVLGWDYAVILDEPGEYEDVLDVMELANLELLEFRTYDAHLDERMERSFAALDRLWGPGGLFRSARGALRDISKLRVEFARLTDNLHDTGKVFGDWYTAQLHRRLHERFHLASWERAVASKMATLEDLFHLAQEEANHRRSLVLELMVVVLFVLDLVLLFKLG